MADKYRNFAELSRREPQEVAWQIVIDDRPHSHVLIIAPHGGRIERGTSELATAIAGDNFSLYCFEGLKPRGNRDLHITSHRFDEPGAIELAKRSAIVVGVHGCTGDRNIYIGGLDVELAALVHRELLQARVPSKLDGHQYSATHPLNICNRNRLQCGVQLEVTRDLREAEVRPQIAVAVRNAVHVRLTNVERELGINCSGRFS